MLSKSLLLSLLISLHLSHSILANQAKECFDKCGGEAGQSQRILEGKTVCGSDDNNPETTVDECLAGCMDMDGFKKAEDQLTCFCNYCNLYPDNYEHFCTEPMPKGEKLYSMEECEKVCNGEFKYYGQFCYD